MNRVLSLFAAICLFTAPAFAQFNGGGSGGGGSITLNTTCPTSTASGSSITLNGGPVLNEQTGTTYTLAATDCGKHVTMNNASPVAVGAVAGTQVANFGFVLENKGAGTVTFTPYSGTINGAATLTLAQYQSAVIVIDSGPTNWIAEVGKGGGVTGPGSSVSGDIATFNGTSGGTIQDSSRNISGPASSTVGTLAQHPGYIATRYYASSLPTSTVGGSSMGANVVYCAPFYVAEPGFTVETIGGYSSANSTATYISYAIFYDSSGLPGNLIDYSAVYTFTGSAANAVAAMHNTTDALKPGWYWTCASQSGSGTSTFTSYNTSSVPLSMPILLGGTTAQSALTSTNDVVDIYCTAGTNCTGSYATWSGSTFNWYNLGGVTWTYDSNSHIPAISMQVYSSP